MSTRILLADDHRLMRESLRGLIEKQPGMELVGEAEDGSAAVRLASKLSPDVVVMDVSMPNLDGIEATRRITSRPSSPKVIILSMHSDRRCVARTLRAGALGYILKDCAFEELVDAIRSVAADKAYLSPAIAGVVVEDYVGNTEPNGSSACSALPVRQREVLQLLAEGKTTKQIAADLQISPKTVDAHRHKLMENLKLYSVANLTRYAIREGLVSLDD